MSRLLFAAVNALAYCRHGWLALRFRKKVGYFANIANPKRYHEYIFWRKVFDRNPLFGVLCDKLACKEYIRSRTPELAVPETLWTGTTLDRAAFDLLTQDTVLKANHGCNMNFLPGASKPDFETVRRLTRKWMRRNYARKNFEHAYSLVDRTLFIEERLHKPGCELIEVQVRVAAGKAILLSAITGQKTDRQKIGYFGLDGVRVTAMDGDDPDADLPADFTLPASFRDAIRFSEILCAEVDYARCDFYSLDDVLFGGEITLYPTAGLSRANSTGIDQVIERDWDLRRSYFVKTPGRPIAEIYRRAFRAELEKRAID